MMGQMPAALQKQLEIEQIKVLAFFGIKKQGEPPFFFSAIWPAERDDYAAVLDDSKFYATAEADSPEEAVRLFRDKLYAGL